MKKYRLNPFYIILNICLLIALCVAIYFSLHSINRAVIDPIESVRRQRDIISLFILSAVTSVPLLVDSLNKYVLLGESFVHYNNYRIMRAGKERVVYYRLMYNRIYKIEHKKRLGIFDYYYVYENSYGNPVKISYKFCKHKELFKNLCNNVKLANPNVEIQD